MPSIKEIHWEVEDIGQVRAYTKHRRTTVDMLTNEGWVETQGFTRATAEAGLIEAALTDKIVKVWKR
jgi:hypothetical protein